MWMAPKGNIKRRIHLSESQPCKCMAHLLLNYEHLYLFPCVSLFAQKNLYFSYIIKAFFQYSILDVWDIYRGLFMRIKRRIHLSESQPRNCKEAHIHCSLNDNLFQTRPGYKLTISNHRIKILASDTTGLRHAITTLIQVT